MEWFTDCKYLGMTREDAETMMNLPDGSCYERGDYYWDEEDVEDIKNAFFVWKEEDDRELHGHGEEDEPLSMQEILDFGLQSTEYGEEFTVAKAFADGDCKQPWDYDTRYDFLGE